MKSVLFIPFFTIFLHCQVVAQHSLIDNSLNNNFRFSSDLSYSAIGLRHLNLSKLVNLSARMYWTDSLQNLTSWTKAGITYFQAGIMRQYQTYLMQGLDLNLWPKFRTSVFTGLNAQNYSLSTQGLYAGNQWDESLGVLNESLSGENFIGYSTNGLGYIIGAGINQGAFFELPKFTGNIMVIDNLNKPAGQLGNIWRLDLHYLGLHTLKSWFYVSLDINKNDFINPSKVGISTYFILSEIKDHSRQLFGINLLLTEDYNPYLSATLRQDRYLLAFHIQSGALINSGLKISYNLGQRKPQVISKIVPTSAIADFNTKLPDIKDATIDHQVKEAEKPKFYLELKHTFNFAVNDERITDSDKDFLDQVVKLVAQNNGVYLKIIGHTDNTGDSASNLQLSWRRARTVANYLIEEGVDKQYCEITGAGANYPLVPNTNPENRRKNRRVEFVIYEK